MTVQPYSDPEAIPTELGASIFVKINSILHDATAEFDLPIANRDNGVQNGQLAVWDGDKFVYQQNEDSWQWWNLAKLFWKYGTAPYQTQKLMKESIATFLKLYEEPWFPFRSLTQRTFELGLEKWTAVTGEQFLKEHGVSRVEWHQGSGTDEAAGGRVLLP